MLPSKVEIGRAFDVGEEHVSVTLSASPTALSFLVSINHPSRPSWFELLREVAVPEVERVECEITSLSVTRCTLDPKMPPCRGCALNR
jgi:hypothetical protein